MTVKALPGVGFARDNHITISLRRKEEWSEDQDKSSTDYEATL